MGGTCVGRDKHGNEYFLLQPDEATHGKCCIHALLSLGFRQRQVREICKVKDCSSFNQFLFPNSMQHDKLQDLQHLTSKISAFLLKKATALEPCWERKATRFHVLKVPEIGIQEYLTRTVEHLPRMSGLVLILVVVFACRIPIAFDLLMLHRFVAACICVGSKLCSDFFYSNLFYAKVFGLAAKDLVNIEIEFLDLLDWKVRFADQEVKEALDLLG